MSKLETTIWRKIFYHGMLTGITLGVIIGGMAAWIGATMAGWKCPL